MRNSKITALWTVALLDGSGMKNGYYTTKVFA
jgi:hypothetical protein